VNVDELPLAVVLRVEPAEIAGEGLGVLVRLEPLVEPLVDRGLLGVLEPAVSEHEVVVGHEVLGVDRQRPAAESRSGLRREE